jgi:hypothetical protein
VNWTQWTKKTRTPSTRTLDECPFQYMIDAYDGTYCTRSGKSSMESETMIWIARIDQAMAFRKIALSILRAKPSLMLYEHGRAR